MPAIVTITIVTTAIKTKVYRSTTQAAIRGRLFTCIRAGSAFRPPIISVVKRAAIASVGLLLVIYIGDYLVLRARSHPYDTVTIQNYYAVPRKDGRTEYMLEEPVNQTCAHSLFPHSGFAPCWYLSRRTEKRENI